MKTETQSVCSESRVRLVNVAGRVTQDLGLGRLFGQVLVYHYLHPVERSLDDLCLDLNLSKAAASTTTRQLESFGLLVRVWNKGDRRRYYKTADNLAAALRNGSMSFLGRKLNMASRELDDIAEHLETASDEEEYAFLSSRIKRAQFLGQRLNKLMQSRLVRLFVKS